MLFIAAAPGAGCLGSSLPVFASDDGGVFDQ